MPITVALPAEIAVSAEQRLAHAAASNPEIWKKILADERVASTLPLVWTCSEFVAASCERNAGILLDLIHTQDLFHIVDAATLRTRLDALAAKLDDEASIMRMLRHFRRYQMVRIAWRDLAEWSDLSEALRDLSMLADVCIQFAHDYAYRELSARYGEPYGAASNSAQPLVILGMGKLGGRELNYSSDIDLIFIYPEEGATRSAAGAARSIENAEFFLRLGQRIINLLAQKTDDGFVYRVDMRLRPFGDSGRMAISFDSFESYLQESGRDWERYAYVKARPITGIAHHRSLYENTIRPFVYRRYLDFGVFESLRAMKELIAREVTRRELHDNIKLGPGGIREIEFIVQAFQLIRGGTDQRLQTRELRSALALLSGHKLLSTQAVLELRDAYVFLRRLENRLQEYNDEQTHQLPDTATAQLRLALAMNEQAWQSLETQIELHRGNVASQFANIVLGPANHDINSALARELDIDTSAEVLSSLFAEQKIPNAAACVAQLVTLRGSAYYRRLDENGRRRLRMLLPHLIKLIAMHGETDVLFARLLRIVERIGGRTTYLALLQENRMALERLVDICARSQYLAEQIAASPLLLDELIDARLFEQTASRQEQLAELAVELQSRMQAIQEDDVDLQIEALRQFQQAAMFRIAVADFSGQLPLMQVSDRLTALAEIIIDKTLSMAWTHIAARYGVPRCGASAAQLRQASVVVVAYGKLGGIELGYGSDLDLVFLHDSSGEIQITNGPQPIDNTLFFARLGQHLVHLLTTHTRAGRLYEVDIRLRPSGKGGLLVQSFERFAEYQRKEAWTWEHQALLRARAVAGPAELRTAFEKIRIDILRHAVRRDTLRDEVRKMRERMRAELAKVKPGQFHLKQGLGGIADLEFLVQYWMLKWADDYPPIITFSDNIRQLESLASGAIIEQATVDFLTTTYRRYREHMHRLSLAGKDDVIADTEFLAERQDITALWHAVMVD